MIRASRLGVRQEVEQEEAFSEKAEVLGAVLDLSAAVEGIIEVTNKPTRVEDFTRAIEELKERGWLS